jgi:hypothetical protein
MSLAGLFPGDIAVDGEGEQTTEARPSPIAGFGLFCWSFPSRCPARSFPTRVPGMGRRLQESGGFRAANLLHLAHDEKHFRRADK